MSDKFVPISIRELSSWIHIELQTKNLIFGIPKELFFIPKTSDKFRTKMYGKTLETPFGVAAGPHTQMAQNIIVAWLCGARFIELKTVQTLDELEISKPCIDVQDVGYNVEWSQELKLEQSFDEYLKAWILIHALHKKLKFPSNSPGIIFNMSVGYNYDGILKPNVQHFLNQMSNAGRIKEEYVKIVGEFFPELKKINVPSRLSDNVTLSTMHGCPPEEIGKIASYLINEKGYHTNVKLNPTLLGPVELRRILNQDLGFKDITVPDIAFEHDLKYPDAIKLLKDLTQKAERKNVYFGIKLSNTLEVENHRSAFQKKEKMMYLSGRPLQAITVNLAKKLSEQFNGQLAMSYAGGADCFNVVDLLAAGMKTITVCSDILRPGGYTRILQYIKNTAEVFNRVKAKSISDFICATAKCKNKGEFTNACALFNLKQYAEHVLTDPLLHKNTFEREKTKTSRSLELFDCIKAPCTDICPINQKAPEYINSINRNATDNAAEIIRKDNPLPNILGHACNHICETACTRTHYDEPIAIRELKRYAMEEEKRLPAFTIKKIKNTKIAIIGAGPCGLSAAYFLAQEGYSITIYEEKEKPCGMVSGTIPNYRAQDSIIKKDMKVLNDLGINIKYNYKVGKDITLSNLKKQYKYTIISVGAQKGQPLGIKNENCNGVIDGIDFLKSVKKNNAPPLGAEVAIIGGGDVAMDCARTANRLTAGKVYIIYRRTIDEMPAHKEELDALIEEGIELKELVAPKTILVKNGAIKALRCTKMELGKPDESGRRRPVEIPNSEFDIALDNLVIAIGQQPDFNFFGKGNIKLNQKGYIDVNPKTLETSMTRTYAGGDAIENGPSTIVKACSDGKKIAEDIMIKEKIIEQRSKPPQRQKIDMIALSKKRAIRKFKEPIQQLPVENRDNFEEVIFTLSQQNAKKEADRCLECNKMCNTCVTVCPNRAIFSYETPPATIKLPTIKLNSKGIITIANTEDFEIKQSLQTAVFTNFCNECGNCATFCPTAGKPYQDKPRFYNTWEEFDEQENNAFIIFKKKNVWFIYAKFDEELHELALSKTVMYLSPDLDIELSKDLTELIKTVSKTKKEKLISLQKCAVMYGLLKNITQSMPELPWKKNNH